LGHLLGDEGRNVGLESTGSGSHDEDTEDEDTERRVGLVEDRRGGGGNEDKMTNFGDNDRVDNGLEATKVGIGNPGSEKRADVDPERVEGGQREGNLLAHVEGTGDSLSIAGVKGSSSSCSPWLSDEVGVDGNGSVVGHALYELDKGNGVDPPWDLGRHTAESEELLVGGKRVILAGRVADIGVLDTGLALREEVRGCTSLVESRVLALGVTRVVKHGGIEASLDLGNSVSKKEKVRWYHVLAMVARANGCVGVYSRWDLPLRRYLQ
jgi:hypothetical protein